MAVRLGALVAAYWAVCQWVLDTGHLPIDNYRQPIIAVGLIQRLLADPIFWVMAVVLVATRWRQLWHDWDSFDYGRQARWFVVVTAGVAAWSLSTCDYNLYFNQGYYVDRLLLIVLLPLVWYRPIFLFVFILEMVSVTWQFDYPLIGQYPWTHMHLVVGVLVLSFTAFVLHAITGSRQTAHYLFVLICLIASIYWWGGMNKLRMGWLLHGHLYLMVLSAYANGWLVQFDPESIVAYAHVVRWFDWPMMLFTVLVEFVIIVVLFRRWSVMFFLICWIAFHFAVFATTGMFFWQWIVMESALLIWFVRSKELKTLPIFTANHFVLSVVFIATGTIWTYTTNLSWFDTPLCHTYRFEAVSTTGNRYPLPTATFAPYADTFTLGLFGYLNPNPQIVHIWGVTQHRATADRLVAITDPEQALALEARLGTQSFTTKVSIRKAERMDDFIQGFFGNLNLRRSKSTWLSPLGAPRHLWNGSKHPAFHGQETIARVEVYLVTTFYDGKSYRQIQKNMIRQITIPDPKARAVVKSTGPEPIRG